MNEQQAKDAISHVKERYRARWAHYRSVGGLGPHESLLTDAELALRREAELVLCPRHVWREEAQRIARTSNDPVRVGIARFWLAADAAELGYRLKGLDLRGGASAPPDRGAVRLALACAWMYISARMLADDPAADTSAEDSAADDALAGVDTERSVHLLAVDASIREQARTALLREQLPLRGYDIVALGPRWRDFPRVSCARPEDP